MQTMSQANKYYSIKIAGMVYLLPQNTVKIRQNLDFSFLLPIFIYLSGYDLFSFSKIPVTDSLGILNLGTL